FAEAALDDQCILGLEVVELESLRSLRDRAPRSALHGLAEAPRELPRARQEAGLSHAFAHFHGLAQGRELCPVRRTLRPFGVEVPHERLHESEIHTPIHIDADLALIAELSSVPLELGALRQASLLEQILQLLRKGAERPSAAGWILRRREP